MTNFRQKNYLLFFDASSFILAFFISLSIRQASLFSNLLGKIETAYVENIFTAILCLIVFISIFSHLGLYKIRSIEISARVLTIIKGVLIWTVIVATISYMTKYEYSRFILFSTSFISLLIVIIVRYLYFRYKQNDRRNNVSELHIIGIGNRSNDLINQITPHYPLLSVFRHDYLNPRTSLLLSKLPAYEIFIADERLNREQVMEVLYDSRLKHHSFRVILDTFKLITGNVKHNDIDEITSIIPSAKPNPYYVISKRLIDITSASVGITLASPLWLIIAAAIKLDSKGPIIIKQSRIGYLGKPFTIYKFRTMHTDTPLYDIAPSNCSDPRITRVGKMLRKFSLDEMPQLWNILKGDMSLVGPRPEMEFIVKTYKPWQTVRLNVKPGLTGLWQILGRKDIPLHENLEYDFYYVSNQNLILDTTIVLKTIPAVLFGRGAY